MTRAAAIIVLVAALADQDARAQTLPARQAQAGQLCVGVALADVDGDGVLDAVTASWLTDQVLFLAGDGSGGFEVALPAAMVPAPSTVLLPDFDADGAADLVATSFVSVEDTWLALGDGAGGFSPPRSLELGRRIPMMAAGDLDLDGLLDLVAPAADTQHVVVLTGAGGGLVQPYVAGSDPRVVALADFDGDGRLDAAAGLAGTPGVRILVGDGAGALLAAGGARLGAPPLDLAAGDLDGDGTSDLVAAVAGSTVVPAWLGNQGTLTPVASIEAGLPPARVRLADLDGVAGLDLVALGGRLAIAHRVPHAGFGPPQLHDAGVEPGDVRLGDLDGDGLTDAVVANYNQLTVLDPGYIPPHNGKLTVLRGTPGGSVTSYASFPGVSTGHDLALADLDDDGDDDALVIGLGQSLFVFHAGDGALELAATVPLPAAAPEDLATGDLDHDGDPDAVTVHATEGRAVVLLAAGGSLAVADDFVTGVAVGGPQPRAVAIGLLADDAHPDLFIANGGSGSVAVFRGDGTGDFAFDGLHPVGKEPRDVLLADLDADGLGDLVAAAEHELAVLLGKAAGGFTAAKKYGDGLPWPHDLSAGDIDGDGALDLVAAMLSGVAVFLNHGDGTFTAPTLHLDGAPTGGVALPDLDADGLPDLLASRSAADDLALLRSTPAGLQPPTLHASSGSPADIVVTDLDADGRVDSLTVTGSGALDVHFNVPAGGGGGP